jgi:hypothetical protein
MIVTSQLGTKTRVCLTGMYQLKKGLKIGQSLIFLSEIFLQAGMYLGITAQLAGSGWRSESALHCFAG